MNDHPRVGLLRLSLAGRLRRLFTLALLAILIPLTGAFGAITWRISDRALYPETVNSPWAVDDFSSLEPEFVTFAGSTNILMSGRFFRGTSGATVILSHGFASTQDQVLPWVYLLNQEGFNVFTYDMRSRGGSGGEHVTLGALEQHDLISAVDYVSSRPGVDSERIAAAGLSLGGSVSILAAARDSRIKAVVSISGFSDAESVVNNNFERLFDVPAFPFAPVAIALAEQRAGARIRDARPVDVIHTISPRPVLLMHGERDEVVTWANGRRNFDAAQEPKQMVWVPEAGHDLRNQLFWGQEKDQVIQFLLAALGGPRVDSGITYGSG